MIATRKSRGGLRLEAHKLRATAHPIRRAQAPQEAVLPLDQHAGVPAQPTIAVGDTVLRGQPIAAPADDISAWLHAPVSGRVVAIEPRPAPHRCGMKSPSVVIDNDGRDERFEPEPRHANFERLDPLALREHIGLGGIVGLGGAAFPTVVKIASAAAHAQLRLLIDGAECEPYISCDDMLMRERAADVIFGARVLLHALNATQCVVAIEDDTPLAAEAMRNEIARAGDERMQLRSAPSIYPAGGERQLIATVFGEEVPFGGLPTDIGILCQNVATVAAVARWIQHGEPLTERVVTVTGDGVQEARNLQVRIGTPVAQLIAECGGYTPRMCKLLMGGTMMGLSLPDDDVPIVKGTNCIVAASSLDLQPRSAEMPCIRCGNCSEVCPAYLLPQQLHLNARAADLPGLERYGLLDCIECGCCDYVCPSQIPLVERFRAAKPALAAALTTQGVARDTRIRFEAREARLQRIAAEQRALLEAKRRQAKRG